MTAVAPVDAAAAGSEDPPSQVWAARLNLHHLFFLHAFFPRSEQVRPFLSTRTTPADAPPPDFDRPKLAS